MSDFKSAIEFIGVVIEGTGVSVIVVGMAIAIVRFLKTGLRDADSAIRQFRKDLGQGILLGLEFLVAGDIIRTVAVDPNLQNVIVLAIIVAVRTFLSFSLQVELEGRWPWQKPDSC